MGRHCAAIVLMFWVVGLASGSAWGQQPAASRGAESLRQRVNQGTVAVISGGVTGTYIRIASDLATVLDDGYKLRILPVLGKGSVQNITDILYLKGIDLGIVQSDVLAFIKRKKIHPTITRRIRYVTKLYNEELHLLGGEGIETVQDLAGKRVNFGIKGSGTAMTASTLFDKLNIDVEPTSFDQALALEKLKNREIAAMVYVAGKPTSLFAGIEEPKGVHFLGVPATPELLETYLPSRLSHDDYPRLIPEGEGVDTIAVGAVLAVYNWSQRHERYRKVARFVEAFFGRFDEFLKPPRHVKWQEVNLAAVVPGWTRFKPAQDWLDAHPPTAGGPPAPKRELEAEFEAFLRYLKEKQAKKGAETMSEAQQKALFEQFMRWQERQ